MLNTYAHDEDFKMKVVSLKYKDGYSALEISKLLQEEYSLLHKKPFTKNAVIGIWNRNPHMVKQFKDTYEVKPKVSFVEIHKKLEQMSAKSKERHKLRKCLRCRKEKLLLKQHYICDTCKSREEYRYFAGDYSLG